MSINTYPVDQAELMFFSKCKFNKQINKLQYLALGYKLGQDKHIDLNYMLSLIGQSIFKAYCVNENRKKYVDTTYIVISEIKKATEVLKTLRWNVKYELLLKFYDIFVMGKT